MENKEILCPKCQGKNLIKRGFRKTENRGNLQRFSCKSCGFRFVQDDGFFRMRNNPKKVTLCLDLFYRGVSTRKIQEHLQAFYPHNSSCVSIYKWVIKYAKKISEFTDKLNISVGSETQVDEVEFHRRKSHKAKLGVAKDWFIDSIDTETRYMIASEYCEARGIKQVRKVISQVKNKTNDGFEEQVKMITTDGLLAYPKAIKKVYGYNHKKRTTNVIHNKNICDDGNFNFPIERLHNSIRQRTKIFRGFHGSVASAKAIMKGFEVFYNFINKHQGINCCPYELACHEELKEKLKTNNKWIELIKLSCI